jgi:hypothetical protein
VHRDGSYLSGHERGVRFGLGTRRPARVVVSWPDGRRTERSVAAGEESPLVITPEP